MKQLSGSFTIEASLVMPVVLFSIVAVLAAGLKLHDIVAANLIANEAVELGTHRSVDTSIESIETYGTMRLDALFSENNGLSLEEAGAGDRAEVSQGGDSRIYEERYSRPETVMRKITIVENVLK